MNLIEKVISDSLEMGEAASLEADVFRGKIIKAVAVFYKRTQELEETEP